jgi:hypothetical protein
MRPIQRNTLGKREPKIVPAKRAFIEEGTAAKNRRAAADPVAAIVASVRRDRAPADEHRASGALVVCGPVAVGIAG